MKLNINVGIGDLLDRYSILIIKESNNLNVKSEIEQYRTLYLKLEPEWVSKIYLDILINLNKKLWDLEDKKRNAVKRYTQEYSDTAELITKINDARHYIKKQIDTFFNSEIQEQKNYNLKKTNEH